MGKVALRKAGIVLFLIPVSAVSLMAHDVYEAHFLIQPTDSSVVVEAEFPWTLRKAVLDYYPQLDTVTTAEGMHNGLKRYVKSSFQLLDRSKDRALRLLEVEELPQAGHDHSVRYRFIFEHGEVTQMRNMLLFNLSKEQKNYNTYVSQGRKLEFVTTPTSPVATIKFPDEAESTSDEASQQSLGDYRWIMWVSVIVVLLAIWMILKRRSENTRRKRRGR